MLLISTGSAIGARLALFVLLVLLQFGVYRLFQRFLRIARFSEIAKQRVKTAAILLLTVTNLPLAFFGAETILAPRTLFLYSPPARFEGVVRPIALIFFIWSVGSFLLMAIAPAVLAGIGVLRRLRRRVVALPAADVFGSGVLERRQFLRMALFGIIFAPFATSSYGAATARFRKVVEEITIPIDGLPAELDGLTIVQISDIHAGLFMSEATIAEAVRTANSLNPDLVALTGDFVNTKKSQTGRFMRGIAGLRSKHGVFGCLGNHDMFTEAEDLLSEGFDGAGYKLLRNENRYIEIGAAKLNVIGIDFVETHSRRWGTAEQALNGIPLDGTTLLLSHNPETFPAAARLGIRLQLAGHTHGGQIALKLGDVVIAPAKLATPFVAGRYQIGDSHLYVNRGLGTTGPPIRINAPPEITHLTLKRA